MAEEQQTTEEEPSIEEILDSIRQIISDDEDEESAETSAPEPAAEEPAAEEPSTEGQDDILELTEKIEEPTDTEVNNEEALEQKVDLESNPSIEEQPEPEESQVSEEPESIEIDMAEIEDDTDFEEITSEPKVSEDSQTTDSILTDKARSAALEGFTELAKKTAVEHKGITLEDIVRSELNPLLRVWLDKHLPPIIDKLVQQELSRISKQATDQD